MFHTLLDRHIFFICESWTCLSLQSQEEPKKVCFNYDLFLNLEGNPPVNHLRCEKLTFNNPTHEFRRKLVKAGGVSGGCLFLLFLNLYNQLFLTDSLSLSFHWGVILVSGYSCSWGSGDDAKAQSRLSDAADYSTLCLLRPQEDQVLSCSKGQ